MDILGTLIGLLQSLDSMPAVAKIVGILVVAVACLQALATSVSALWKGAVGFVTALAMIPGLSGLSKLSQWMSLEATAIDTFENGTLLPLLAKLSALQPPTKK